MSNEFGRRNKPPNVSPLAVLSGPAKARQTYHANATSNSSMQEPSDTSRKKEDTDTSSTNKTGSTSGRRSRDNRGKVYNINEANSIEVSEPAQSDHREIIAGFEHSPFVRNHPRHQEFMGYSFSIPSVAWALTIRRANNGMPASNTSLITFRGKGCQ